jgi:hypothetical protein
LGFCFFGQLSDLGFPIAFPDNQLRAAFTQPLVKHLQGLVAPPQGHTARLAGDVFVINENREDCGTAIFGGTEGACQRHIIIEA